MGAGESTTLDPSAIENIGARQFFESISSAVGKMPEQTKNQKTVKKLTNQIFESLKHIPAAEKEFGLMVQSAGNGPTFADIFLTKISYPSVLTKISFRNSGLKPSHAAKFAKLLVAMPFLKQFDCSDNAFGDAGVHIIRAAVSHPNLQVLQMEDCKLTDSSIEPIQQLLLYNRKLQTLRLAPLKITSGTANRMMHSVECNTTLRNINLAESLDEVSFRVSERNSFIFEFVDSIARSPFQRQFRAKLNAFKSVKGREMLIGRARQKERAKGTEIFSKLEQVDERARTTETSERVQKIDRFRMGMSEMVGRRSTMEDVSISLAGTPTPDSCMFGVFDGHGGREAAEYAAEHLPQKISSYLKQGDAPSEAYVYAFKALQTEMRPWCVYVGCTACIASIEKNILTVANIGDTRCVLCSDGKAQRLSLDHKPNLPEETAYIQSKGGFVRDDRVGGMLAVSRAFGDGFLGDSINSTPYFVMRQLTPKDDFLIIACDGVWDVMSDQQACDIVLSEIDPLIAAKKIQDTAFELESTDNISVIVVSLHEVEDSAASSAPPSPKQ